MSLIVRCKLALVEMHLQGSEAGLGVSTSGLHHVALCCSLRTLSADGKDECKGPGFLVPGAEDPAPQSTVSLHRRAIKTSCLCSLCQNSAFTLPVSKLFFLIHLRRRTEFQNLGVPLVETCVLLAWEGLSTSPVGVALGDKGQPGGMCAEGTRLARRKALHGHLVMVGGNACVSGACWCHLYVGPGSPRAEAQEHLICRD